MSKKNQYNQVCKQSQPVISLMHYRSPTQCHPWYSNVYHIITPLGTTWRGFRRWDFIAVHNLVQIWWQRQSATTSSVCFNSKSPTDRPPSFYNLQLLCVCPENKWLQYRIMQLRNDPTRWL